MTVDALLRDILRREGGYVDHPNDRGGATNWGVSLRYAKGVGLDLDGDGDTDKDDIRLVTPEVALALYREDFYEGPRIDRLPEAIQPVMVDWAVNSGPPRAIMGLQEVLTMAGFPCTADGVIGPQTRRQAEAADRAMGPYLVNALVDMREHFYRSIVARNPSQRVFLNGWLNRAREFRVPVSGAA